MRIREITENWANNHHMGMGTERPQDQRLLEKPRMAKHRKQNRELTLKDNIGMTIGHTAASGSWANTGAKYKQM
jgi:hypothetical protein